MIQDIFFAFWFFLPAGLANAAPVIANKIPYLNTWKTPLDFGYTHNGKRILGNNKTVRGVVFGTAVSVLTVLAQSYAYNHNDYIRQASLFNYNETVLVVALGITLGLGALLGDATESFFKRKHGFKPGTSWFPFDQTDYIVGGLIMSSFVFLLPLRIMLYVFAIYFGLHLLVSYIAYLFKLKDTPI